MPGYPDGNATAQEIEELLSFAMEARRRVREHILRIDDTFKRHDFVYRALSDNGSSTVLTPEEIQYPAFAAPQTKAEATIEPDAEPAPPGKGPVAAAGPKAGHVVVPENTKGWSYRRLFAEHLKGARKITIRDPFVRLFFQARNLMELLQMIHDLVPEGDEVAVHLITQSDAETAAKQAENLEQMAGSFVGSRVAFSWELDRNPNFHARSITTDTGWKITIDRGLDIFQKFESGPFSVEQAIQEARLTRGAEVSYLKV